MSESSHAHCRSQLWALLRGALAHPFLGPCLHEGKRAKDNKTSLGFGLVASLHIIAQFHDPRRRWARFGSGGPDLGEIALDGIVTTYTER